MGSVEGIFTGCNRNLNIFDYNKNLKVIAYGSHNTVSISCAILDASGYKTNSQVETTLKNHSGEVTTVKWIQTANILLSGCQDGIVNVWQCHKVEDSGKLNFTLLQSLKPNMGSISTIGLVNNDKNSLDFVVGDCHGKVYFYAYKIEVGRFEEISSFQLPYGYYAMAINIIKISDSEFIILAGGSKPVIQVMSFSLIGESFKLEISLSGHEDWVRSIDTCELKISMETVDGVTFPKRTFIFASGSLDRIIRLWKLTVEESNTPVFVETNKLKLLTSKEYKFSTNTNRYCLFLDAILMAHDDWVSEVSWKPRESDELVADSELMLLSSSADSSIMIWKSDPISGVWFPEVRLGEMAIKGASTATGSSGGFYCSKWIIDKETNKEIILTNGKTGSFRCWVKDDIQNTEAVFRSRTSFTGPIRSISDISWGGSGDYILVTSLDQSTRLYCRWKEDSKWYEFGRPQIHGFDMISVKSINGTRFVSAGDEKVIRVFDMPKNIAHMLNKVCGLKSLQDEKLDESLPESASLPVLGLSNKAALDNSGEENSTSRNDEDGNEGNKEINNDIMNNLIEPPVEDILQRHTLWPEIEKLYGHGFEITTLDVSHDGKIIASACRSNVAKHAVIRNFNTESWLECEESLGGHDLTITRLRFSLVDEENQGKEYLLSVSRDRKFSLWERKELSDKFSLVKLQEKAHSRIIWDCAWVNYAGIVSFVTCSRDKEVKLWKMEDSDVVCKSSIKFEKSAVTAIDSIRVDNKGNFKLVIGLDSGELYLYQVNVMTYEFQEVEIIPERDLPGDAITRISISPAVGKDGKICVAVGSRDNSVRMFAV